MFRTVHTRISRQFRPSFRSHDTSLEERCLAAATFTQANSAMLITAYSISGNPPFGDDIDAPLPHPSEVNAESTLPGNYVDGEFLQAGIAHNKVFGPDDDPGSNSQSIVIECTQLHKDVLSWVPDSSVTGEQSTTTIVTSGVSDLCYTLTDLGGPGTGSVTVDFSLQVTFVGGLTGSASGLTDYAELDFQFNAGPISVAWNGSTFVNNGAGTASISNTGNVHTITLTASAVISYGSNINIDYYSALHTGIYYPAVSEAGGNVSSDPSLTLGFSMNV